MAAPILMIEVLKGKKQNKIPFWFMRQAGRYLPEYRDLRAKSKNFLHMCYTPELATEITLQPVRRFDMDAAIIFSDILVVPHALGLKLDFIEKEGPRLETVDTVKKISALNMTGFLERLNPVFETLAMVRKELASQKTLIGFAGAPWTVACYMVDGSSADEFEISRKWAAEAPEDFSKLIDVIVKATAIYLKEQIRSGAQVLQIFDSWAGLLGQTGFERWVIEPTKRLVAQVKEEFPEIPIIGFPRMAGTGILRYAQETGIDAVSLDYTFDTEWVAEDLQKNLCVQGNLDPILLNAGGAAMEIAVKKILNDLSSGPFIFNLGHGIMQTTPIQHVERLCEMIRAHG